MKYTIVNITREAESKHSCVQNRENLLLVGRIKKDFTEEKALELVFFWTCLISLLPKIVG